MTEFASSTEPPFGPALGSSVRFSAPKIICGNACVTLRIGYIGLANESGPSKAAPRKTRMTGSQKQIEWANSLKTRVERWIARAKTELPADKHAQLDAMFDGVLAQTNASWWIDYVQSAGVCEITEDLQRTGGNFEIKAGAWQRNLQLVAKLNNKL
jgi:hypothetical protein